MNYYTIFFPWAIKQFKLIDVLAHNSNNTIIIAINVIRKAGTNLHIKVV